MPCVWYTVWQFLLVDVRRFGKMGKDHQFNAAQLSYGALEVLELERKVNSHQINGSPIIIAMYEVQDSITRVLYSGVPLLPPFQVSLWKESREGEWVCVSEVDKGQQQQQQQQTT